MVKTVGLTIRETIVNQIQEKAKESSVYFFAGFSKVNSSSLSQLRNDLRLVDSYVFVAKNSLIRRAFEGSNSEEFKDYLQGETGIVFVYTKDFVKSCKILVDFSKENENFILKGGVIDSKKISKEDLESLAKLPPREVLLGQAVSGIAAPLSGFVACLNQIILKFIWAANEIKKVKESSKEDKGKETEKKEDKTEEDKKEDKTEKQETEKQEVESKETEKQKADNKEDKAEEDKKEDKTEEDKKEDKPEEGNGSEENQNKIEGV